MKNKSLYILTENLNFFYRLNKVLSEKKIIFKILSVRAKIPSNPSLILTTYEESQKIKDENDKIDFLAYSKHDNFEEYVLRVIAAIRIGFKDFYSKLTFSIDPGKKIGLMIFLDDFYFDSFCCFEKDELTNTISTYIDYFQKGNPNLLNLLFKFGRGVIPITFDLVETVFNILHYRDNVRVFLIDEFKSSKIKINNKKEQLRLSRDEVSALILALRDGIEVDQKSYLTTFEQLKGKKLKREDFRHQEINKSILTLSEVAEKVVNGQLSLIDASEMLKSLKAIK